MNEPTCLKFKMTKINISKNQRADKYRVLID